MVQSVSRAVGRFRRQIERSRDIFGTLIADGTRNRGDLASHYRYDPENYRFYRNGERDFLMFDEDFIDTGSTDHIDDTGDTFTLSPEPDDELVFQSADRFRYVVLYESDSSLAWETNRELEGDEMVQVTYDASPPGEFGEDAHGVTYTSDGVETFITRDGEEIATREVTRSIEPPTTWKITDNRFNWYNVGRKRFEEYFGADNEQQRNPLNTVVTERERGPRAGNGRVTIKVVAGAGDDLEVEVGSMGFRTLGTTEPKNRTKTFRVGAEATVSGEWHPVAALRVRPEAFLVTTDLFGIFPLDADPSRVQFNAVAIDDSLTDASGWTNPPELDRLSNAVQFTTDVSEMPDADGEIVSSTDDPGGYQLAYANNNRDGQGQGVRQVATTREVLKRLHDTDVALVLGNVSSTGDIPFEVDTLQEK